MNVYDYLMTDVDPDKIVIQSRTEQITYADLLNMIRQVGAILEEHGTVQGQYIAIIGQNSSFWIASYLGILRYGAVAVPVPIDQHPDMINQFLEMIGCHVCFIDEDLKAKFESLPTKQLITPDKFLEADGTGEQPVHQPAKNDLATLMFTSGSTGVPNAVKVSHLNIITNTKSIVEYLKLTTDDRIMTILPFYYCFGTSLLHTHLRVGGSLVLNNRFMFVEHVFDDMENYACTGFAGVPSIYQRLIKRSTFTERNFETLRYFQQAGGRLSHEFIKAIVEAFPKKDFYVMYGQTEATSRLSYLPPGKVLDKVNSIGKAIPYTTLEIVDEEGKPVKSGEQGEIVASGDNITLGYWHDEPNSRYVDGKLYTGDMATMDAEGYITIVGRKSDFLKPGGNRFSSHKIVDVLLSHPQIYEAEVLGVYNTDLGEIIHAFVGVGDNELSANDVKRYCLEHLPRFAIPHEIVIKSELPKNNAGKIQRRLLLDYD